MCGIAAYYCRKNRDATQNVMLMLYAQQHRGQESCGIAAANGHKIRIHKAMGYVKEAFPQTILEELSSNAAIGHVRYPTRGEAAIENTQPYVIETLSGPIYAVASNGDIVNYEEIADELRVKGVHFASRNDGELLGRFIVYHHERKDMSIVDAIHLLMRRIKGAYSAVFLTHNTLYAFRDRGGFRPMLVGNIGEDIAVASESCALDILRPDSMREVAPGEVVVVTPHQVVYQHELDTKLLPENAKPVQPHHCIFELIYFARPDSYQFNEYVYEVRHKIGSRLASYDDDIGDVVVPVPDSANFIAMGYAMAKKIPFHLGLIRNHYVGRTFIRPDQYTRDESVRQKFNPLKDFFSNKRVILVDDSIVRGTTIRKLVRMVKGAGAREVHLRIGSPPVKHSCYYGIDTPNPNELIANNMEIEQIREYIGADSLKYLRIEDLRECVKTADNFCYACFNGNYPFPKLSTSSAIKKELPEEETS
ncbi:MAG: amidophosphoribosyltransferase [Calditrichaeota bacterium]|nr:MAG: amidophosphoribosyltransferase [Calditrichota bacterium]